MKTFSMIFFFIGNSIATFCQVTILPSPSTANANGQLQYVPATGSLKYFDGNQLLFLNGETTASPTKAIMISATAFHPVNIMATNGFQTGNSYIEFLQDNFQVIAPINLPRNATITNFQLGLKDNSATNDCVAELIAYTNNLNSPLILATVSSSGSAGWQYPFTNSIIPNVPYHGLSVRLRPTATWDANLFVVMIYIQYQP